MNYIPKWLSLIEALQYLGFDEMEDCSRIKADLSRAIADRQIAVRVRVAAKDASGFAGKFFQCGNVGVPPQLQPSDFDWQQSIPLTCWSIGPVAGETYTWIANAWELHPIDLIQIRTADIENMRSSATHAKMQSTISDAELKKQFKRYFDDEIAAGRTPKKGTAEKYFMDLYPKVPRSRFRGIFDSLAGKFRIDPSKRGPKTKAMSARHRKRSDKPDGWHTDANGISSRTKTSGD
jgi:hypothetical protein